MAKFQVVPLDNHNFDGEHCRQVIFEFEAAGIKNQSGMIQPYGKGLPRGLCAFVLPPGTALVQVER